MSCLCETHVSAKVSQSWSKFTISGQPVVTFQSKGCTQSDAPSRSHNTSGLILIMSLSLYIDHWNYFQTSKGHATWFILKVNMVWHLRVSTHLLECVPLISKVATHLPECVPLISKVATHLRECPFNQQGGYSLAKVCVPLLSKVATHLLECVPLISKVFTHLLKFVPLLSKVATHLLEYVFLYSARWPLNC